MKLFLPIFILASLSFVSVLGDTGSITVTSGKSYVINYDAKNVQISDVQVSKEEQGLIFSIQSANPNSTLELTLPRELIDATKKDGSDDSFIVLIDGTFTSYVEKSSNQTSRTILIQLGIEDKEIEIIGTYLAGSGIGEGMPQTSNTPSQNQIPTTPNSNQNLPQNPSSQNQTSTGQKTNAITSEKPEINKSEQTLNSEGILLKKFHFEISNFSFEITVQQMIEYVIIAAIVLIIIIVITSSKKSKAQKHVRR